MVHSRGRKFECCAICAHTTCGQNSLQNGTPFPQCFIDQLMDTRPKCQVALCQMIALLTCFYITPSIAHQKSTDTCAWLVKRINKPKTSSAPRVQTPSGPLSTRQKNRPFSSVLLSCYAYFLHTCNRSVPKSTPTMHFPIRVSKYSLANFRESLYAI